MLRLALFEYILYFCVGLGSFPSQYPVTIVNVDKVCNRHFHLSCCVQNKDETHKTGHF